MAQRCPYTQLINNIRITLLSHTRRARCSGCLARSVYLASTCTYTFKLFSSGTPVQWVVCSRVPALGDEFEGGVPLGDGEMTSPRDFTTNRTGRQRSSRIGQSHRQQTNREPDRWPTTSMRAQSNADNSCDSQREQVTGFAVSVGISPSCILLFRDV